MNDSPIVLKEKEIYSKLTEESLEKINNLDKKVDNDFSESDNALGLIDKIRNGEINLDDAKGEHAKLRSDMGEIKRLQKKHLLNKSREVRTNIENLYNTRKAAIDFFEEYTSRASEAIYQAQKTNRT